MIITIDGPTASGKSSLAHAIAAHFGYTHINSGFLFRGVAYSLMTYYHYSLERLKQPQHHDIDAIFAPDGIRYVIINNQIHIMYKQHTITPYLKTPIIDQAASLISPDPYVRSNILALQRHLAQHYGNIVIDGRDAGSVVFPHADIKIFLTATPAVRAERWRLSTAQRDKHATLEQAMQAIMARDERDTTRVIAPLVIPHGAFVVDNSSLTMEQTIDAVNDIIKAHSIKSA